MGINGLLNDLEQRYPLIKRILSEFCDSRTCHHLYFDMSSIFLDAIAFSEQSDSYKLTDDMKNNIFYEINSIVHLVQPKKSIFFSFEGPAPFAKLWQKRQRFYQRMNDPFQYSFNIQDLGSAVENALLKSIEEKTGTDPVWKRIDKIYFAGPQVPGEAETKIFSYIRKKREDDGKPSYDPNDTHWICTNDSDLIVMSLMCHEPNITLLFKTYKDIPNDYPQNCVHLPCHAISRNSFKAIDISLLRDYLFIEIKKDDERILDDIAFLCLTLGFDYIPQIQELNTIKFENIINLYKTLFKENQFIIDNNKIIWENLIIFLENRIPSDSELFTPSYLERFKNPTGMEQETKKLCRQAIEAFEWTFQLYKTASPPSWSWIYGSYFIPPLKSIIEEMKTYHPSFPTEGPSKNPTNLLEVDWISLKPVDQLLPPNLLEIREKSKIIEQWNKPNDEVIFDKETNLYAIPSPNLDLLRAELRSEVIPNIYPEDKFLIENKKVIEIKSNEEIDIIIHNPKPFTSQNFATARTGNTPSFLSGPFERAKYKDFIFSGKGTIEISSLPKQDIPKNSYVAIWPYSQVYKVNCTYKSNTNIINEFRTKYKIFLEDIKIEFADLTPVNPLSIQGYRTYSIVYPITLCTPCTFSPPKDKVLKCKFLTKLTTLNNIHEEWLPLTQISKEVNVPIETLKTNILFKSYSNWDYGMQFYTKNLEHFIPFYVKISVHDSINLFKGCIEYIKEYIEIVGEEHLTDEKLSDETYNAIAKFLTKTRSELPFYCSEQSKSYIADTISSIENEIKNMTPITDEKDMKTINLKESPPTINFDLGQTVIVVDDRSVAPVESTGVIVALDKGNHEAWVVMHGFDDGIKFGKTLNSYRGLILNYCSLRVIK